jgi:hypothetical protein
LGVHQRTIATAEVGFEAYEKPFQLVMDLLGDCEQIYTKGDAPVRRLMNPVFFDRLLVRQGDVAAWELKDPWYTIRQHGDPDSPGTGSDHREFVTSIAAADVNAKSSNNEHLAAGKVRVANSRWNAARSSNKAGLAAPTGFEPVSPP